MQRINGVPERDAAQPYLVQWPSGEDARFPTVEQALSAMEWRAQPCKVYQEARDAGFHLIVHFDGSKRSYPRGGTLA